MGVHIPTILEILDDYGIEDADTLTTVLDYACTAKAAELHRVSVGDIYEPWMPCQADRKAWRRFGEGFRSCRRLGS